MRSREGRTVRCQQLSAQGGDHQRTQLRAAPPKRPRKPLRSWRSFPQPLSCRYDHEQKLPHGRSQARTPDCPHRDLRAAPRGPQTAGSRPTRAHRGRKGPRRAGKCRKASRRTERCRTALVESSPLSSAMVRALAPSRSAAGAARPAPFAPPLRTFVTLRAREALIDSQAPL